MVRQHQTRNLEVPGSMLRIAPERRCNVFVPPSLLPEALIPAQRQVVILPPHPTLPAASPYAPLPPPAPAGSFLFDAFSFENAWPELACFHLIRLHLIRPPPRG